MSHHGYALQDIRSGFAYVPGNAAGTPTYGWNMTTIEAVNQIPTALSATIIAAAQVPTAGTAMTLASTSVQGLYVNASVRNYATGRTVTGTSSAPLLALDMNVIATVTMTIASPCVVSLTAHGLPVGTPVVFTTSGTLPTGITSGTTYYVIAAGLTLNAFQVSATLNGAAVNTSGSQSGTQTLTSAQLSWGTPFGIGTATLWNPATAISRNMVATSVGNDSTGTLKVSGYDMYGQAMSETITLSNASTAAGKKAFKYITSAVPGGTLSGSNLSLGTGDVYGLPVRADYVHDVEVWYNNTLATTETFVAADQTNPATSTTGDVRGTTAPGASNGSKRVAIFISVPAVNLASSIGMYGVTQA